MRIGILTFHKSINYGAFLQAYSLSDRLKKEFPQAEVEVIDYVAPKEGRKLYINAARDLKNNGIAAGLKHLIRGQAIKNAQKYLPVSNKAFCTKDLQKLYAYINDRYDCLVIGSDAVFNWKQNGFPTAFIPDYGFTIPVMTYAASVHGLRYYDEQPEKLAYCRRVFEKMAFIGTRDACTAQFVKCCMPEAEPVFCCDPTLFIDQDKIAELAGDYVGRVEKKYCFSLKEKYIVQMVADSALTRQIRERYGHEYKIVTLFRTARHADIYLYDLNPFEWAMVLRGAAATITSYFHGTLLSLVQGTPVVALDYSGYDGTYESKLYDLMNTRLNLPGFYHTKQYAKEFTEDEAFWPVFEKMLSGGYTEAIGESIEVAAQSVRVFVDVVAEKAVMRNG